MKKTMLILFTLIVILTMALTITSVCFAEETEEATIVDNDTTVNQTETADNNGNLWFTKIWNKCKEWVIAIGSGLSIAGLGTAVGYALVKTLTTRTANKIADGCNSQTIADKTSDKLMAHLGNAVLDVNIKPVLQSQYKAMSEEINAELTINLQKQDKKNLAVIKCFEAFADYFKCSTAVSEEQKQALADTIAEAKALYENCDNTATAKIEVVAEAPKVEETKKAKVVENY